MLSKIKLVVTSQRMIYVGVGEWWVHSGLAGWGSRQQEQKWNGWRVIHMAGGVEYPAEGRWVVKVFESSFDAIAYEELKERDIALVNPGFDEHTGWGWYRLNSSECKETWKGFPLHSSVKPDSSFHMTHSMLSLLWWFSYFLASFLTEVWKYFKYLCSYICTGYEVTAHHRHHTNSYVIHLCVSQPTHKSECE